VEFDGTLSFHRTEDSDMDAILLSSHLNLSVVVDTVRDLLDAIGDQVVPVANLELPHFVEVMDYVLPVEIPNFLSDFFLHCFESLFSLAIRT